MTFGAMRALIVNCCPTNTPQQIYSSGDSLKMPWVDAASRAADMIDMKPLWHFAPTKKLVGHSMSIARLLAIEKSAIAALGISRAYP